MRYPVIEDGMIFQDGFLGPLALRSVGGTISLLRVLVFFHSAWKYTGIPVSQDKQLSSEKLRVVKKQRCFFLPVMYGFDWLS